MDDVDRQIVKKAIGITDEDLDKVNAAGLGGLAIFSVKSALMFGCSLTCGTLLGLKDRLTPTMEP